LKKLAAGLAVIALAALVFLAAVPLHPARSRVAPRVVAEARVQGPLSAGAAAVPIDVPPGTPVAGFPRLRWASQGVRDAPMVRALVLREPGLTAAIVSAEILLVPPELRRRVEARLADLELDALLLAATHTHAGPGGWWEDALGERIATGPYDARRLEALAGRIEEAVRLAVASLAPARLSVSRARLPDLARNRGGGLVDGRLLVLRAVRAGAGTPVPGTAKGDVPGTVPGTAAVVAVVPGMAAVPGVAVRSASSSGDPVGQVVVFPAHATLLGSRNRLISGDWPGALARELPGTTVFLQGAVGDQSVALPGDVSDPDAYGRALAAEIARLPISPGDADPPLAVARAEVALPGPSFGAVPLLLDRLFQNLLWRFMPERSSVLVLRAGPALLVAVPAEPGEEVGRRWRDALGADAEVVSLAGDYLGYVETPQKVRARTGEAQRTYLGPDLAYVLGDGLAAAAAAIGPAARAAAPPGSPPAAAPSARPGRADPRPPP